MTLFSSIQVGKNALFAAQIGLHVAGNNIANANTPGYVRQEVVLTEAPTVRIGNLLLGSGVRVLGIIQRGDQFLDNQLRGAISDLANGVTQEQAYRQLEGLLGELNDTDLSTSLVTFFSRIQDILNQPEDIAVRNLAVLQGIQLTDQTKRMAGRVQDIRMDLNERVVDAADRINLLLSDIARLNAQVTTSEGGDESRSSANATLRNERSRKLEQLAEIIEIRTVEQSSGGVTIFTGGDQLVFEGIARQVKVAYSPDRGMNIAQVELADTNSPLMTTTGQLSGLVAARDDIVGTFSDQLDDFSRTLIFEFNKIYSGGQGLVGLDEVSAEFTVASINDALDNTGLTYVPETGSFQVQVRNKLTGITKTTDIFVQLNGFSDDTSLSDVSSELNAIDGLSTEITPSGQLIVRTDSPDVEFAFRDDTSGVLAALGLNTFFTGQSSLDIGVHQAVREDPFLFAASESGIGIDTENVIKLVQFLESPLVSQNNQSLADLYERLTIETSQATAVSRSVADGFRVFRDTLLGRQLGLGGVNIDEEVVRMITFQRMFQASARFVSVVSEVLEVLVNL